MPNYDLLSVNVHIPNNIYQLFKRNVIENGMNFSGDYLESEFVCDFEGEELSVELPTTMCDQGVMAKEEVDDDDRITIYLLGVHRDSDIFDFVQKFLDTYTKSEVG